jgi:hypothetical protein
MVITVLSALTPWHRWASTVPKTTPSRQDRAPLTGLRSVVQCYLFGNCSGIIRQVNLAYIHTFNDADVIDKTIAALLRQTRAYDGWPRVEQDRTGFLTCLHPERWHDAAHRNFTWRGLVPAKPTPGKSYCRCDNAQWSGCLYRMAAVCKIGFPNVDYFVDWSESEYDYRMVRAGFKGFVCRDAPIKSNIRGYAALRPPETERANATAAVLEYPPFRCYYTARNRLYFTLYEYEKTQPVLLLRMVVTLGLMMIKVLLLQPGRKGLQMRAFTRGIWNGLTGNIATRY